MDSAGIVRVGGRLRHEIRVLLHHLGGLFVEEENQDVFILITQNVL